MYREYSIDTARVRESIHVLKSGSLQTLATSLYQMDTSMVRIELQGMSNLVGVHCLQLHTKDLKAPMIQGVCNPSANNMEFPLIVERRGAAFDLGTLTLNYSYAEAKHNLFVRILVVLGSNFLKTLLASLCILVWLHFCLMRHLRKIQIQLESSAEMASHPGKVKLERKTSPNPDELDAVVLALNERQDRIDQLFHVQNELLETQRIRNAELSELLYILSHDLRSPLINVVGYSEELSSSTINLLQAHTDGSIDKADIASHLGEFVQESKVIEASARMLFSRLNVVTDYLRLNRLEMNLEYLDLNLLFDEVVLSQSKAIATARAEITRDDMCICYADRIWLARVIQNIFENALRYAKPNVPAQIQVHCNANEGFTQIIIEDRGVGISTTDLGKVFQLFYQVNPKSKEGQGLGLALARKAMERMGGTLKIESELGEWTRVTLSLPEVHHV